jgi:hypothetical protein
MWFLFFLLLFLVILIFFLIKIVFQFHHLWFSFIFFVSNLIIFLFKSTSFKSFFFNLFFSSLSLIILVGLEFYIVIFRVCPLRCDPVSWSVSQILKVRLSWLRSFLITFKHLSIIIEFDENWFSLFFLFWILLWISFFFLILPFSSIFFFDIYGLALNVLISNFDS